METSLRANLSDNETAILYLLFPRCATLLHLCRELLEPGQSTTAVDTSSASRSGFSSLGSVGCSWRADRENKGSETTMSALYHMLKPRTGQLL